MIISLHGLSVMHSNLETDIRIAGETGFQGIELIEMKLYRYINNGYTADRIKELLEQYHVRPCCINALKDVETLDKAKWAVVEKNAHTLCSTAKKIGCPTVQVVPLLEHNMKSPDEVVDIVAENLAKIAAIGAEYGVRFQLEPIAFTPLNSLKLSLKAIHKANKDNLGMVIDFWHLSAGGDTLPDEVAKLDKNLIYGVHFCDGVIQPIKDARGLWDEEAMRSYLPGEGQIDVRAWTDAVKSTGYDGCWSCELYSPKHWEWDIKKVARETKHIMEEYII